MSPQLQKARTAVASEIGPDVGEFTPPGEKHFLGEAAMLAMAGSFLAGFFKGFAKAAGEKSGEKLGTALVDFIKQKISGERAKTPDEQTASLVDSAAEASRAVALTPQVTAAISAAVEKALAAALSEQAEPDIADRVAERVRVEALQVLAVKAA